jgi:predicted DCC family thiol-disulfide oxidoreductase YuxK
MATVLFDGACNLCNGSVRFIIENDPAGHFKFASLQSPQATAALARAGWRAKNGLDSIVLIEGDRIYRRSDAALRIAAELRAPWGLARALLAIPAEIRDGIYDWVAKHRYEVFGRRDLCALPEPGLADRFLT